MSMEQFSGKTARAIQQGFYAKVLTMSLCAIYAYPVQERIEAENEKRTNLKHEQKINLTNALSNTYHLIGGQCRKRLF